MAWHPSGQSYSWPALGHKPDIKSLDMHSWNWFISLCSSQLWGNSTILIHSGFIELIWLFAEQWMQVCADFLVSLGHGRASGGLRWCAAMVNSSIWKGTRSINLADWQWELMSDWPLAWNWHSEILRARQVCLSLSLKFINTWILIKVQRVWECERKRPGVKPGPYPPVSCSSCDR